MNLYNDIEFTICKLKICLTVHVTDTQCTYNVIHYTFECSLSTCTVQFMYIVLHVHCTITLCTLYNIQYNTNELYMYKLYKLN